MQISLFEPFRDSDTMKIAKNAVVQFNYRLKDEAGKPVEASDPEEPMAYLHGYGNIIAGLEKALENREAGERFSVTVPPGEAYGARQADAVQRVAIKHLRGARRWRPGMVAEVQTDHGPRQVQIVKVGKFMADVDTNHPLAGKTLEFEIEVVAVREATEEELAHGHAHGAGGHHHG